MYLRQMLHIIICSILITKIYIHKIPSKKAAPPMAVYLVKNNKNQLSLWLLARMAAKSLEFAREINRLCTSNKKIKKLKL